MTAGSLPAQSAALREPLDVSALGTRIRLVFADELDDAAVQGIEASWKGARLPSEPESTPDDTILVTAEEDLDLVSEMLTVRVTLAALGRRRGEMFLFHACGVADPDGRVAAFIGPSGRGKTTLSRALGAMHGYVSGETVAVDDDLRVRPYRKPLSVVREGRPKEQLAPEDAGLRSLPDAALVLTALVLLERDEAHSAPHIEQVELPDAIAELVPQMSYLAELPRPLQALAELADRIGGIVRLNYPDASMVAPLLPELLDHARVNGDWAPAPVDVENLEFDLSTVVDAIRCGDRVIVLAERWVHVLDGIAPVIWLALTQGRGTDEIVRDVLDVFGPPPEGDAHALVVAAIDRLADDGILRRRA